MSGINGQINLPVAGSGGSSFFGSINDVLSTVGNTALNFLDKKWDFELASKQIERETSVPPTIIVQAPPDSGAGQSLKDQEMKQEADSSFLLILGLLAVFMMSNKE